ncbi:zinc finger protein 700-like [Sitodiplosis mosellana]|uniref:zinc finger protein 700-like n=1 Tax=Sitodiplosis mosellana TaxID=263140 RepID=UPI0024442222|nr:zinc finger protein 700-like [Sitodiplosis mosellana]
MCFTVDQIEQACGLLLLNEFNTFVYCCKKCQCDFDSGPNLEVHILSAHQDDKSHIENVFVNDDIFMDDFDRNSEDSSELQVEKCAEMDAVSFVLGLIDIKTEELKSMNKFDEKCEQPRQDTSVEEKPNEEKVEKRKRGREGRQKREEKDEEEQEEEEEEQNPTDEDFVLDNFSSESSSESDDSYGPPFFIGPPQPIKKRAYNRTIDPNGKVWYCDMCPNVRFKCKANLQLHMKRHIENRLRKPCPICKKKPKNYERHMQMNHTVSHPYKCDYDNCNKAFKSNTNLHIHQRLHTGETPFLCPRCGKAFTSLNSQQRHHKRVHSDKLPHPCKECGRTFICPSQLQDHIHSFHSGARPHVCETCGKSYATKKYLRTHKQFHGEKRWQCRHCDKKFYTNETRRFHEKTIHNVV